MIISILCRFMFNNVVLFLLMSYHTDFLFDQMNEWNLSDGWSIRFQEPRAEPCVVVGQASMIRAGLSRPYEANRASESDG